MSLAVITTCDKKYIRYASVFTNSLYKFNQGIELFVRAVNCYDECVSVLPSNVSIIRDDIHLSDIKTRIAKGLDTNHPRMNSFRSRLFSTRTLYSTHSKFQNAIYLLDKGYQKILVVDADAIINGSLDPLIQLLDKCELSMQIETENDGRFISTERVVLKEDVMAMRNTQRVNNFYLDISKELERLENENICDIDSDTEVVSDTFHTHGSNLQFVNLPLTFNDNSLSESSIIWSGQGAVKFTDKFANESKSHEG